MKKNIRNAAGFTLIELITALAVVAAVTKVFLPAVQ